MHAAGYEVRLQHAQTDCCPEIPQAISMHYNRLPPGEVMDRIRSLILEGKNPCEVYAVLHRELFHSWRCSKEWVTKK